jgi:hypothetical protein
MRQRPAASKRLSSHQNTQSQRGSHTAGTSQRRVPRGACREGDPSYTAYLFTNKQLELPLEAVVAQALQPEAER